ncbi:MAG: hypothetical protein IH586_08485 [Anaerolineaceae bacterium]|nr:hypothetical protein [Anaerolineaceae bacterium]
MFVQSKLVDFFLRMGVGILVGLIFAWALSEISYQFLNNKESLQREPQQVELIIPYGTSQRVKDGQSTPSIPSDMIFVVGDVLVIKNEDIVDHQVGPLWIPSKTSGVLSLDTPDRFAYECSFEPTKYLGLDVRERVTTGLRLQGLLAIALPSGMMLGVYSYLIPNRKKTVPA